MYFKFFPNLLSLSRIIITPFIAFFIFKNTFAAKLISLILFFIGALTDFLDGYIARRYKFKTNLGTYLDPLADKILILVTFCLVSYEYPEKIKIWMITVMFLRDVIITFYRKYLISINTTLNTSKYAKFKTLFQILVIHIVLFLHVFNPQYIILYNHVYLLVLLCTLFSILTAIHYFWINLYKNVR